MPKRGRWHGSRGSDTLLALVKQDREEKKLRDSSPTHQKKPGKKSVTPSTNGREESCQGGRHALCVPGNFAPSYTSNIPQKVRVAPVKEWLQACFLCHLERLDKHDMEKPFKPSSLRGRQELWNSPRRQHLFFGCSGYQGFGCPAQKFPTKRIYRAATHYAALC